MPPSAAPAPVITNNFDTPEYDTLQLQKTQPVGAKLAERIVRDCVEDILLQFNLALHEHKAHTRTIVDAIDSCLATCLEVIEMQYPAREDNPVSAISLEHNSWEQEKPPDTCTFDSWLRSALPETAPTAPSTSNRGDTWVMQQFLNKQPSILRSPSVRSTGSGAAPEPDNSERDRGSDRSSERPLRSPIVGYAPGTAGGGGNGSHSSGGRLGGASSRLGLNNSNSTRSLHGSNSRRNVTKLDIRKVLTPEQEHLEEQLRQELQQRKTQGEMSRRLEQRDAEERSKLASLRKELKGKDYTYDHKGEVVILNEFDPERTPLEALSGPGYKVAGPEEALRAVSPKRRSAQRSGSVRSMSGSGDGAGGIGSAGSVVGGGRNVLSPTEMRKERDRRLANDFKKITPRTQPSALETLMPAGGVTLRGAGGASKSGPSRQAPAGITREAYAKQVAKKAMQAQQHVDTLGGSLTPLPPAVSGTLQRRDSQPLPGSGRPSVIASGARVATIAGRAPAVLDPLAAYGDNRYDVFSGARPRQPSATARGNLVSGGQPQTATSAGAAPQPAADVNLSLTSATDWGVPGNGRSYEAPMALPHSKPTEKQLVETVGRADRLPRDRAPLPTMAPPISPLKVGMVKPQQQDRLQFHSILSEKLE